jgi:hypothetical protein
MTILSTSVAEAPSLRAMAHDIQTSRFSSVSKITRHIFGVDRLAEIRAQGAPGSPRKGRP